MPETKTWRTKYRPAGPDQAIPGRWGGLLRAVAATPTVPPHPRGDLSQAAPEQIAAISQGTWDDWRTREYRREAAIKRLLHHLAQFPGETWQQRWEASGLNEPGHLVRDLEPPEDRGRSTITGGLEALLCLRVIQPGLPAMRSNKFLAYARRSASPRTTRCWTPSSSRSPPPRPAGSTRTGPCSTSAAR